MSAARCSAGFRSTRAAMRRTPAAAQAASAPRPGSLPEHRRMYEAAALASRAAWAWAAFRSDAVIRRGADGCADLLRGLHRWRSFGSVRSAASFPPPYQATPPSRFVWHASPTEYPARRSRPAPGAAARAVRRSPSSLTKLSSGGKQDRPLRFRQRYLYLSHKTNVIHTPVLPTGVRRADGARAASPS